MLQSKRLPVFLVFFLPNLRPALYYYCSITDVHCGLPMTDQGRRPHGEEEQSGFRSVTGGWLVHLDCYYNTNGIRLLLEHRVSKDAW